LPQLRICVRRVISQVTHDISCLLVGVPIRSTQLLLQAWGDPISTPFVVALAEETV